MIRNGGSYYACIEQLCQLFASEQYSVAPCRYAHILLLVFILWCANLELISRSKLDLSLLKPPEYITRFPFLKQLVTSPQVTQLIVLNLFNADLVAVDIYTVVKVTAPQNNIMLKQFYLLIRVFTRGEHQRFQDLLNILVATLYFGLRGRQMSVYN